MDERIIGDYRLIQALHRSGVVTTWLAEQTSVSREVTVDELVDFDHRETFLADTRAKASVDHPLIGSVYEAITEDGQCLVAMEKLPGETLAARLQKEQTLLPIEFSHLLRSLSEAMIYLGHTGIATEPLTPEAIHFDSEGVLRIGNIARAGAFDPEATMIDIQRLGTELPGLIQQGQPGASRALTVLAWMRGEGIERPLTWEEVHSYGEQIESQLVEVSHTTKSPETGRVRKRKSPLPVVLATVGALILIAGAAAFLMRDQPSKKTEQVRTIPAPVVIEAGEPSTPNGDRKPLPAFRISATEITIGEYAEFLETLGLLEPESRSVYDAKDQPPEKTGHQPADWDAMYTAARQGTQWDGKAMDLFCPITNIDWWDAAAFCDWKKGRLPTLDEWDAALRKEAEKPEALKPSDWRPVTEIGMADQTPNGLFGMAGSVSEWTHQPERNPANPLGERRYVLVGASFKNPDRGALAREWTDDRSQRRGDLGFRVVWPE